MCVVAVVEDWPAPLVRVDLSEGVARRRIRRLAVQPLQTLRNDDPNNRVVGETVGVELVVRGRDPQTAGIRTSLCNDGVFRLQEPLIGPTRGHDRRPATVSTLVPIVALPSQNTSVAFLEVLPKVGGWPYTERHGPSSTSAWVRASGLSRMRDRDALLTMTVKALRRRGPVELSV